MYITRWEREAAEFNARVAAELEQRAEREPDADVKARLLAAATQYRMCEYSRAVAEAGR